MQSWPDAVPFDPEIGADSPVLEALVRGPAAALSAVLLVVGDAAQRSGFGARAAFAIADAWMAGQRMPVLVDLAVEAPSLHEALGVANDEGVADAVAFGTSLRVLWRPVDGHRFAFLSSGYASDAGEVRSSTEWRRIIAQEAATGHTLLLYVPAHGEGVETLAGKVGAVIVIGEDDDLPGAADSLPRPYAVVAVLKPDATVSSDESDIAESGMVESAAESAVVDPTWETHDLSETELEPAGLADPEHEPNPLPDDVSHSDIDLGFPAGTAAILPAGPVPSAAEFESSPEAPGEMSASEDVRPARTSPPLIVDDYSEIERAEAGLTPPGAWPTGAAATGAAATAEAGTLDRVSEADFRRIQVPREGAGREELIADLRARQRAALMAPPADSEPIGGWPRRDNETAASASAEASALPAQAGLTIDGPDRRGDVAAPRHSRAPLSQPTGTIAGEPPATRRGTTPSGRRLKNPVWAVIIVAALLVMAASAAYWLKWRTTEALEPVVLPPNTAIPPVDSLAMIPLPYVVAIEAHLEMATAEDRLQMLASTEKNQRFFVAPIVRGDVPYYHVFAGPLLDSAAAGAALDSLLARKVKTGTVPGDVRQLPLSFLIDQFPSESDATSRMEELRKTGIPTFVVMGSYGGRDVWRVYGGAYAGPAESDVMRQLLKGAGIRDSLVTRTGRSNK